MERACADVWPAMVDEPLGRWRLRAAGGFTGRANSALTLGDPGVPLPEALGRVLAFAARHGVPPTAHVVVGSAAEAGVAEAGWAVDEGHPGGAASVVLVGPLAGLAADVPAGTSVLAAPPADWWPLAVGAARPSPAQRHVLAARAPGWVPGYGVARDRDGRVVGVVRGAVVGDLLHVARLAVEPGARRAGVATGLLAALARWAPDARRCVLQVAEGNRGALALYGRLGCAPHHRYRYWTP